ncbi:type I restriction endonuclease subunit R (plasmid) [Geobacillus stearothermophilus]|nr:type I restriction endonuclease subunit R [Geobacillus stearothermophilus]
MSYEWAKERPVEHRLIKQLEGLGYTYLPGNALDSERASHRDVVLEGRLRQAIQRLNPWIDDINLHKVVRMVTHINAASTMEANEKFYDMVVNYVSIQQDLGKGKKGQTVKLIDFDNPDNNEFLVVNQLKISGPMTTIIPDVILFINGLPLVVIECKNPTKPHPISEAVQQLLRYQQEVERLFHYNHVVVATCNEQAKFGSIGARLRHFGEWKDPYPFKVSDIGDNPTRQDVLVAGMFSKKNLLDMIQNFVVYEAEGGRTIKKVCRYQQFRAVNKAVERILTGKTPKERGGVVWATQGSGKSLTMLYLSVKLRRLKELRNPSIVIVTDRTDLDEQITNTFRRCGFPNPQRAESVKDLRELLRTATGATIMTTIQKFQDHADDGEDLLLNDADNIFVLVDESHRTNYGGLAMNMRASLPNAVYIGFTGTPIDKEDRSTVQTFGTYIDTYTIQQAVEDGATVPIYYESRLPELRVEGESLDAIFERVFQDYSKEEREQIKKKYATEEAIIGAPQRIRRICLDIIEHYEKHIAPNGFKAQIVAINRETAVLYKEILDELNGPESVVIISPNNNDDERLKKYHLTKEQQKHYIERFKKPLHEDKLAFIIVCDMLLTGFDAPIEQVMYLDKPLKEHNLLQAIARTNRTYDKKTYGLIVDYYGVSAFLKQALAIFNPTDVQGALTSIESEIPRLQARHRAAMRFFDHVDRNDIEACMKVLEPEDVRHAFDQAFKRFAESMDMIMPNPAAKPYHEDLKFLGKVRQYARNRFRDEQMDISDCGEKVKRLIYDHIYATDIKALHRPVSILEKNFDAHVKNLSTDQAKASEMEHAIRHEIRVKINENPVYYTSLKERLEQLIQARKEKRINDAQLAFELEKLIEEMRGQSKTIEEEGLTPQSYPIFQLLQKEWTDQEEEKERLKEITQIIVEHIEGLVVIDWVNKEDVKREMRKKIKRQLRTSKCPSDKIEPLAQQIVELAEIHYKK